MWNKIAVVSATKMPPRPQRPPELTKFKRVRPLDQSKQKHQRRSHRSSISSHKRADSDNSRDSCQSSRVYFKKPSMQEFSKADLSFKDQNLSPIRKSKTSALQNNNISDGFINPIPIDENLQEEISQPREIMEQIKKHKDIITELQVRLGKSLQRNERLREVMLRTRGEVGELRKTVSEILRKCERMVQDIPQLMLAISNHLQKQTSKITVSSPVRSKHHSHSYSNLDRSSRDNQTRTKEQRTPSQLMDNILKTIAQVRMQISLQKQGSFKVETQMWTRESKA